MRISDWSSDVCSSDLGLMEEIATAAEQQASGLHEISATVASMDTVTQQNAAMVEESTAGARNLSSETERLFEQLSFFELGQASHEELGRAAVRERGCQYVWTSVVAVSLKKKKA